MGIVMLSCSLLLGSIIAMGVMTSSHPSLLGSMVATGDDVITPVVLCFSYFK
jgi:hypothetical protein